MDFHCQERTMMKAQEQGGELEVEGLGSYFVPVFARDLAQILLQGIKRLIQLLLLLGHLNSSRCFAPTTQRLSRRP